jgi:signal transduction histidine kinase
MNRSTLGWYAWTLVILGGLVAAACLASTWYINRLQADHARAVRYDAARMDAADELQVQLRHLRFHSVVCAAEPTDARRDVVRADTARVEAALAAIRRGISAEDAELLAKIDADYAEYIRRLGPEALPPQASSIADLVRWSDDHPMQDLLLPCRELADKQRSRMDAGLATSELQTSWAGGLLLALGITGAVGGLLSGYATARGISRRATQLSVRVQAVHAHLDQEVGAMMIDATDLDEQLDRVVGRVKDVCQRLQEQERDLLWAKQLAAVGQLAAGVAHEVRNPLTGIKFLVEATLRPTNPTSLTTEDLQLIRQEIVRMERTVQGLLDYARTPPPDRQRHDLVELIGEAVSTAKSRAEAKRVVLRSIVPSEPLPAIVDRDQMLSLMTNLVYNAIDAAPPASEVAIRLAEKPNDSITVEVTDSGSGIPAAVAGRLFTPFATTKPTGSGLGLTIAQRVARDHGGAIEARERPEGGTSFTLTLPAKGS